MRQRRRTVARAAGAGLPRLGRGGGRYLGAWRAAPRGTGRRRRGSAGVPAPRPPSPKQVRWWLLLPPERRTARQQAYLDRLLADTATLRLAAELVREFGRLLRERDLAALEPWLARAEASGLAEFAACARSLRQDRAAIEAALTHEWSNGQTEGQVTRLKLVKRQMFGRAKSICCDGGCSTAPRDDKRRAPHAGQRRHGTPSGSSRAIGHAAQSPEEARTAHRRARRPGHPQRSKRSGEPHDLIDALVNPPDP